MRFNSAFKGVNEHKRAQRNVLHGEFLISSSVLLPLLVNFAFKYVSKKIQIRD